VKEEKRIEKEKKRKKAIKVKNVNNLCRFRKF